MQCYNCLSERIVYSKVDDSYQCMDCGHIYPKEYWFVSHSHLDIEKVRIVRNVIEETFFYEPILFFLKCLSDDNEVTDLIQREIHERVWFVYCQSANAKKSVYVQKERKYLDSLIAQGHVKHKIEIDLDKFELWDPNCKQYIREQVMSKIRKSQIMFINSYNEKDLMHCLHRYLQERGYNVFSTYNNLRSFDRWTDSLNQAIKRHTYDDGVVLLLVSPKLLDSSAAAAEIEIACNENAAIIPVLVCDGIAEDKLRALMGEKYPQLLVRNYIKMDPNNFEEFTDKLLRVLEYFYYIG